MSILKTIGQKLGAFGRGVVKFVRAILLIITAIQFIRTFRRRWERATKS